MAEPIEIQFGVRTRVGPGNRVLGAVKILPRKRLQLYFLGGGSSRSIVSVGNIKRAGYMLNLIR